MLDKQSVDDIVANNRLVDESQLESVRQLVSVLRETGIRPTGYNLERPFTSNPRPTPQTEDRRTVRLRS
jgi:hypothetical protein